MRKVKIIFIGNSVKPNIKYWHPRWKQKQINSVEPFRERTDLFCEEQTSSKRITLYQLRKTLNNSVVVRKVSNSVYSYCHTLTKKVSTVLFILIEKESRNLNLGLKLIHSVNIAFARGGAHLPIAHALRLLSTKELQFGLTKLKLRKIIFWNNFFWGGPLPHFFFAKIF